MTLHYIVTFREAKNQSLFIHLAMIKWRGSRPKKSMCTGSFSKKPLDIYFIYFYYCARWGYIVAFIKSSYSASNIPYLNSSSPPFSFIPPSPIYIHSLSIFILV
jgi:hypothetical protein